MVALGLFFNRRWAKVWAAVLLILFIAVLGYGIWLGLDIDCGCFGPGDPEHDAFSGLRTALVLRPTEHGPRQTGDLVASADWDFVAPDLGRLAELLLAD